VVMVEAVGDVLRVFTTSATLGDAVESATFHATLFESVAFDEGMQGQTDWLTVQMHGAVSLAPTLDLRFAVSGGELAGFELGVTGTAAAQLGGAVQFTSSEHWTWGDEKRVSSMLFRRAFAIGPIPIVVVGRMTTVLGAQAYVEDPVEMYAGASAALTLDARSQFTPGLGWVTSDATTYAVTQDAGTQSGEGHASLAVGVFPRFELAFFGNQEAELGISAQTGALATYCNPAFVTGQQAQLQGAAHFRLASLANPSETTLTLFDRGFSLDPIEQCTP